MSLIVQKFGGSSVKDAERLRHVAGIITEYYDAGNDMVVVVSAQGKTTDELIAKAKEISDRPGGREMDMLMSTGEQISASLLVMVLNAMGYSAISLTGWQAGFLTDSNHTRSRIRHINKERLENELDKKNIVVVTGFQGINRYDDITTLGRGGSDTSAVALAAALGASRCQIYTDVDGVYTADPRLVENAVKLNEITYDEMLELASLGAKVLHNRSVEMAKKYNVQLEVLSSLERKPGTIVKEVVKMEKMLIKGVAKDDNVARISLVGLPDKPGIAFKVFSLLASRKINVDIILQSVGHDGTKDILFTIAESEKEAAAEALREIAPAIGIQNVTADSGISKVSIVGAGMESNPGVAAKMFEALGEANINIHMISTSEIKISVLIDKEMGSKAVLAIHDKFAI
ncbi:MAG: aspartate kinase [Oscillospiraceae bacterium]|jgi:aspartate kinase|nr:aspartate kinase [Oscillospiraceae bacterium]